MQKSINRLISNPNENVVPVFVSCFRKDISVFNILQHYYGFYTLNGLVLILDVGDAGYY